MAVIEGGGVTAAKGFLAAGVHAGVKSSNPEKRDVALIYSELPCSAAAVFTTNAVKAAPVLLTMKHLADGRAQAVIANSGNANACAPGGEENAEKMAQCAAQALGISPEDVVVASTGVIGQRLNVAVIEKVVPALAADLSPERGEEAALAIMTTDTVKKEFSVSFSVGGKTAHIGGICKGSGMIHPNMGTMLCFITTDAAISPAMLDKALKSVNKLTFSRVSVDGDTSTNDTCAVLANGMCGNAEIFSENEDYFAFYAALKELCTAFARAIAADGEGASHLITCRVSGAGSDESAEILSKSVISSSLVKAAMFGADANWGRVLCAMGYSGAKFEPGCVAVSFRSENGDIEVCENGEGLDFDEDLAKKVLSAKEIIIDISAGTGAGSAECWGCDLTYDYVRINGDYRT